MQQSNLKSQNQKRKEMSSLENLPVKVFKCVFEIVARDVNITAMKGLWSVLLQWKETTKSKPVRTFERANVVENIASFNEQMTIQSEMIFVEETGKFFRKETSLILNLISANRSDLVKPIGRIVIDLAEVLDNNPFAQLQKHKFMQSPIKSVDLQFAVKVLSQTQLPKRNLHEMSKEYVKYNINQISDFYSQNPKKKLTLEIPNSDVQESSLVSFSPRAIDRIESPRKLQFTSTQYEEKKNSNGFKRQNSYKPENKGGLLQLLSPLKPIRPPQIFPQQIVPQQLFGGDSQQDYTVEQHFLSSQRVIPNYKRIYSPRRQGGKQEIRHQSSKNVTYIQQSVLIRKEQEWNNRERELTSQLQNLQELFQQDNHNESKIFQLEHELENREQQLRTKQQQLKTKSDKLYAKYRELQNKYQQLKSKEGQDNEVSTFEEQNWALKFELSELKDTLQQKDQTISKKQKEIKRLQSQNFKIGSEISFVETEAKEMNKMKDALDEIQRLKTDKFVLEGNVVSLNEQVANLNKKIEEKQNSIQLQKQTIEQLFTSKDQKSKAEIENLSKLNQQLQDKIQELIEKNAELQENKKYKTTVEQQVKQFEMIQKQYNQLQDDRKVYEDQLTQKQTQYQRLKQEFQQKVQQLTSRCEQMQGRLEKLGEPNEQKEAKQKEIMTSIQTNNQILELSRQNELLSGKNQQQQKLIEGLNLRNEQLRTNIEQFKEQYTNIMNSVKELQIQCEQKENSLKTIKEQTQSKKLNFERLKEVLTKQESQVSDLRKNVENLTSELNNERELNDRYKVQIQDLQTRLRIQKSNLQSQLKSHTDSEIEIRGLNQVLQQKNELVLQNKARVQELEKLISNFNEKNQDIHSFQAAYKEKQAKFVDKEHRMRQHLRVLEQESQKIFDLMQTKEQTQEQQQNKIRDLQEELIEERERNLFLEKQSQSYLGHLSLITEENNRLNEIIVSLREYDSPETGNMQASDATNNHSKEFAEQFDNSKLTLKRQLQHEKQRANKVTEELYELKEALEDNIRQSVTGSNRGLDRKVIELETKIKMSELEIADMNSEIDKLQEQKRTLQHRLHEKEIRTKILEQENKKVTDSKTKLENKLMNPNHKQVNVLKDLLRQKQEEIFSLRSEIELCQEKTKKMKQLQETVHKKQKEINKLSAALHNIGVERDQKQRKIQQLDQQIDTLKRECVITFSNSSKHLTTISQLKERLSERDNKEIDSPSRRQQKKDISGPPQLFIDIEKLQLQKKVKSLQQQLDAMMSYVEEQTRKAEDLIKQNEYLKAEVDDLVNKKIARKPDLPMLDLDQLKSVSLHRMNSSGPTLKDHQTHSLFIVLHELRQLLEKRSKRQEVQAAMQLINGAKRMIEKRMKSVIDEYGIAQQKARILSMEFQRFKSAVMKRKLSQDQKMKLLSLIKPSQLAVKEIVELTETLADYKIKQNGQINS